MIVSGITTFPELNGQYIKDENLTDCGAGKARYRQIDGPGFIFKHDSFWSGGTTLCEWSLRTARVLNVYSSAESPDLVTSSWYVTRKDRSGDYQSNLVKVVKC